jgi:ubiquinone/menaquinone biosynthesis C-methylase UbiE
MPEHSHHVCPWYGIWTFDNLFRPLIHDRERIFGSYVRPGMTVLDLGCGAGYFTLSLARLVGPAGKVIAVDLQPQMLAMLERRARRAGLLDRITRQACTPDRLGLTGVQADFANAFWMVHEAPDSRALLDEVRSALKPRGRLLVVEPRGHVSAKEFSALLDVAQTLGWAVETLPAIAFSRAALLEKK